MYNELIFTEALDQVEKILASGDTEEVAQRIEEITKDRDLSMACMTILFLRAKGVDLEGVTGVTIANLTPTPGDLVLPPGWSRELRKQ